MSDCSRPVRETVSRFFSHYLLCPDKDPLPEKQMRWSVKRVEEFIKAQKGRTIKTVSANDVTHYLEMPGRRNRLSGRQFAQGIDAIRILYGDLLETPVCQEADWDYWHDPALRHKRSGSGSGMREFCVNRLNVVVHCRANYASGAPINW